MDLTVRFTDTCGTQLTAESKWSIDTKFNNQFVIGRAIVIKENNTNNVTLLIVDRHADDCESQLIPTDLLNFIQKMSKKFNNTIVHLPRLRYCFYENNQQQLSYFDSGFIVL